MRVITRGNSKPIIGIVGMMHGNEPLGEEVIAILSKIQHKTKVVYLVANEEAGQVNKRFVDTDLNRCFPGNAAGNHEERLAANILKELAVCDFVIDIHATTARTEGFIIITKQTRAVERLVDSIPLPKSVIIGGVLSQKKTLI